MIITEGADLVNTNPDDMDKQDDSEKEVEMDVPFELAPSILKVVHSHHQVVVGTHNRQQDPRNWHPQPST